jgi:hypothetical protein
MLNPLWKRWDRFWFSSSDHYQYGLFRILLVVGLFVVAWDEWQFGNLSALSKAPAEFAAPTFLVQLFGLSIPLSPELVTPLLWLLRILILTSALGLATRFSLIALATLNLYLNSLINSFGFIDHATTLPSLTLLVLAFAPGVAQFSLDALIVHIRKNGWTLPGAFRPLTGTFPVWPAHLILVIMALAYFSSGYSKIRFGSLAWMDGRTLATYLGEPRPADYFVAQPSLNTQARWRDGVGLGSFVYSTGNPTRLARALSTSIPAVALLSIFTVLFEITFPLVLIFRRLLPIYLIMGVLFHVGIMLTLSLYSFYSYIVCYLLFVDWKQLEAILVRVIPHRMRSKSVENV